MSEIETTIIIDDEETYYIPPDEWYYGEIPENCSWDQLAEIMSKGLLKFQKEGAPRLKSLCKP